MPMLKTVTSGTGGTGALADYLAFGRRGSEEHALRLQKYLAGADSSRALAFGHSPNLPSGQLEWADAMDATRRRWGKDRPPAWFRERMGRDPNLKWRSYYHWVLSPAAEDRAGAAEVAEMAEEWLRRMWPAEDGYQWVYSVHDDNGSRIMHAHTVLNAVNDRDGRKVWVSRELSDALAAEAQKIAAEHGMSVLPDLRRRRRDIARGAAEATMRPERVSAAEAALTARGKRSWVAETRRQVDESVRAAEDWTGFLDSMEAAGFKVEWSRRGIGFRHPDSGGSDLKVLGSTLGLNYIEGSLRARIGSDVDEALSEKAASRRRERHMSRARGMGAEREAVRELERSGVLGRPGRTQDPTEVLLSRARMRRRDHASSSRAIMDGLAAMRNTGATSAAEVYRLATSLAADIESVSDDLEVLSQATETVEGMRAAVESRSRAAAELSGLQKGVLDVKTRRRRNELEERIVDAEEKIARGLASATRSIGEQGIGEASEEEQIERLRGLCLERRQEAESRLVELSARLEDVRTAERAMDAALGRRVETRVWNSRGQGLMPVPNRASAEPVSWDAALARAEAGAKRSALAAAIENERVCRRVEAERARTQPVPREAAGARQTAAVVPTVSQQ